MESGAPLLRRLTPEQARASDPAASIWVAASAGTGKTHVLTARVLRLLLGGVEADKILCLTFTKAAAAEMSNRLLATLGEWTRLDDAALAAGIDAKTGARPDAAMIARARKLFARVLDLPEGLKVQTIHSFCQALLGRFPLEAGVAPQFEVMNEDLAGELMDRARDQLIARARSAGGARLAAALADAATEVGEDDFAGLMQALVAERRHLRRLFDAYGGPDGVSTAVRRAFGLPEDATEDATGDATEESLIAAACAAVPEEAIARLTDVFAAHGGKAEKADAPFLRDVLALPAKERAGLWDAYQAVFLTQKGEPRSADRFPTKAVAAALPAAVEIAGAEGARLAKVVERRMLARVARFTDAALALGHGVMTGYEAEKARRGVLDYDDLILRTEALLKRPGIAPWILYKLDAGVDHVLVDEAQDTNPEQWAVIERLTADFFAGESARPQPRTLFAVGDVKQSIFGFQRADPREFIAARDRVGGQARAAGQAFATVPLDLSFRSTEAVLELVDAVFADPEAAAGLTIDRAAIAHRANRAGDAGLVELWPVEPAPQTAEPAPWEPPLVQEAAESAEARLAVRMAAAIARMIEDGERLDSRGRAVAPGDIMVLVRRRTAFVDHLVKALKLSGVPAAGADRMKVAEQLAVQDLLALARVALLPQDDLSLAVVLKGPFVGLDEARLFDLAHRREGSLWAALTARAAEAADFAHACETLAAVLSRADTTPPFEFFSQLLAGGGRRKLIARLGEEINDPLDEFLALAQDFERDHAPSLQGFVHWMASGAAEIKRDLETGRNAVRILTVHGAKGLQAPVVFLPDTCQTPSGGEPLLRIPPAAPTARPELDLIVWRGNSAVTEVGPVAQARAVADARRDAEYRRLLYVALTRAEDRLYAAGWETRRAGRDPNWYERIAAGMDRLAGVQAVETAPGRIVRRYRTEQTREAKAEAAPLIQRPDRRLPDWAEAPPKPEPAPPTPLAPSQPEEDEPAAASPRRADREPALRGRLIHRLLELLPDLPLEARADAARRFLLRPAHGVDAATAQAWYEEVAAILDAPAFAPLFAPGSRAEAPIAALIGAQVISGQVDRLAVTDEAVLIVDYKTNRPPPEAAEDVASVYLRQMAAYRAALGRIFPGKPVRCALLWTDGPRLMDLPDALLDPYAPDAQS